VPPRLLRPGAPAPSCSPVSHATDDYNRQHNNKGRHRIWLSMLAAFRTSVRKQKHANSKLINNKTTYPPLRCTIAMTLCLSAYKSVFYQNVLTVELVCGMDASFGISYTLCKEIYVSEGEVLGPGFGLEPRVLEGVVLAKDYTSRTRTWPRCFPVIRSSMFICLSRPNHNDVRLWNFVALT